MNDTQAKYRIGDTVCHRFYSFRGVIYDVDPEFNNSDEWYEAIPEDMRPVKQQPFYHLLAQNDEGSYEAYVSEQNLLHDTSGEPIAHPAIEDMFVQLDDGAYQLRAEHFH